MSKIYDNEGARMTNEQVATALQTLMPSDHKALMAIALKNSAVSDDNPQAEVRPRCGGHLLQDGDRYARPREVQEVRQVPAGQVYEVHRHPDQGGE